MLIPPLRKKPGDTLSTKHPRPKLDSPTQHRIHQPGFQTKPGPNRNHIHSKLQHQSLNHTKHHKSVIPPARPQSKPKYCTPNSEEQTVHKETPRPELWISWNSLTSL